MKIKASQKGRRSEKEREMAAAAIDDVTDYRLTSGDEVQVLSQQIDGRPAEILLGAVHDGDAAMAALSLAEAAALADQLAALVKASS